MPCYDIHIKGDVFKTGFRYYLKARAEMNGITGRVYYQNDGSVRVIISCKAEALKTFLEFCNITNPFFRILQMEISETADQKFSCFEVADNSEEANGHRALNKLIE